MKFINGSNAIKNLEYGFDLLKRVCWIMLGMVLISAWSFSNGAESAVVRAVLFYAPSCEHCHLVMTEVLPPLQEQYGDQLQIQNIDTSTSDGQAIYEAAVKRFNIPADRRGVPTMILGDVVMVGSQEIPAQLPLLIENGLKNGGVPWPDIPGLPAFLSSAVSAAGTNEEGITAKIMRDPAGNILSIVVLAGMLMVFGWEMVRAPWKKSARRRKGARPAWRKWAIPVICVVGLAVAGYLSYVEVTATEAVCGPVGDCNSVQTSKYALILGFLPVGVLGLMGYIALLAAWALREFGREKASRLASDALMLFSAFGILFSIYLTFLEPFVIGATCAWCLASSLLMMAVFWVCFETSRDLPWVHSYKHAYGRHGGARQTAH